MKEGWGTEGSYERSGGKKREKKWKKARKVRKDEAVVRLSIEGRQ